MIDWQEDLIEFVVLMCVFIGFFVFMAYIILQAREYSKNDNSTYTTTINNNRGNKMTKRLIDADALLDKINKKKKNTIFYEAFEYPELKSIINELTTSAIEPQSQESIYGADGWCWDLNKIPKTEHLKMEVFIQSKPVLLFYKGELFVETVNFTVDGKIAKNQNFYKADCWRLLPPMPTISKG